MTDDLQPLGTADAGKGFHVEVTGYTDASGTERFNYKLRQERAGRAIAALTARGINANIFVARKNLTDVQKYERKVAFKVTVAQ